MRRLPTEADFFIRHELQPVTSHCSRRGNVAVHRHIDPGGPSLSLQFFGDLIAAPHRLPSYSFEVLAARNGCLMDRQESATRFRATPLTLVHLDPGCRP